MDPLRVPPAKPSVKYWNNEARKLMLINYKQFRVYADQRYWTSDIVNKGAKGLVALGFWVHTKSKGKPVPFIAIHGPRLLHGCSRVWKSIEDRAHG